MKSILITKPLAFCAAALLVFVPAIAEEQKAPNVTIDPNPVVPKPGMVTTFAPIVEKVAPSVVTISTSKMMKGGQQRGTNPFFNDPLFRRFFGLPDEDEPEAPAPKRGDKKGRLEDFGLGSGVIVSPEGHILTNNHVIEGADEITVRMGSESHKFKATKIGSDPEADLAVLKIDGKDFPAITFADSDKVRVGDVVIAVGNPFNFTRTVTMGIVSALGRGISGLNLSYQNFIQTDASINPGNSGGALVDTDGRLIGINTAIFSRTGGNQGIGFAVPGNLVRSVMESIIKHGRMIRGFLGISLQPLDEDLVKELKLSSDSGALVADVTPGSPAEKGGIKREDVIVALNGKPVENTRELQLSVGAQPPGAEVELKLLREGKEQTVRVKLGERNPKAIAQATPSESEPDVLDGVEVADLTPELRKEFDVPESAKGVIITQIDADSESYAAGLRRGDLIHEINREAVTSAGQAVEISEKLKKEKKVFLRVSTKGVSRFLVVAAKQ